MRGAGARRRLLAFDERIEVDDGYGGRSASWSQMFTIWGEMIYRRGGEEVQAADLAAVAEYKVRLRSTALSRSITGSCRMRTVKGGLPSGVAGDTLPGARFNVREVDTLSDVGNVWLVAESGVAV
jgi:head-tail adaptor